VRFRHVLGACALALATASCSLGEPTDAGSINVFVEVDKATLPLGESMTITVTTRNVGVEPQTLTGPSNCLMVVEVLNSQGQIVWNSNGSCAGATVTEVLAPNAVKIQAVTWDGTNLAGSRLGAGYYHLRPVALVTGAAIAGPLISVVLE
jgi:hypothetical protein